MIVGRVAIERFSGGLFEDRERMHVGAERQTAVQRTARGHNELLTWIDQVEEAGEDGWEK